MTTRTSTYPLRLPVLIKNEPEKVAVLQTVSYYAVRRGRKDWGRSTG
jgi:hypothetical protein